MADGGFTSSKPSNKPYGWKAEGLQQQSFGQGQYGLTPAFLCCRFTRNTPPGTGGADKTIRGTGYTDELARGPVHRNNSSDAPPPVRNPNRVPPLTILYQKTEAA